MHLRMALDASAARFRLTTASTHTDPFNETGPTQRRTIARGVTITSQRPYQALGDSEAFVPREKPHGGTNTGEQFRCATYNSRRREGSDPRRNLAPYFNVWLSISAHPPMHSQFPCANARDIDRDIHTGLHTGSRRTRISRAGRSTHSLRKNVRMFLGERSVARCGPHRTHEKCGRMR
jgi:hypothetical protein